MSDFKLSEKDAAYATAEINKAIKLWQEKVYTREDFIAHMLSLFAVPVEAAHNNRLHVIELIVDYKVIHAKQQEFFKNKHQKSLLWDCKALEKKYLDLITVLERTGFNTAGYIREKPLTQANLFNQ